MTESKEKDMQNDDSHKWAEFMDKKVAKEYSSLSVRSLDAAREFVMQINSLLRGSAQTDDAL